MEDAWSEGRSFFSPHLDKLPRRILAGKEARFFADNPGAVARLLLEAYDGCGRKVEMAAKLARRVARLLEHEIETVGADRFVDAAESGQTRHLLKMLDEGQLIDAKHSVLGYSALFGATLFGHLKAVAELVQRGADVHCEETNTRKTPLHVAAENGRFEIVRFFLEKAQANKCLRDSEGMLPYEYALINKHQRVIDILEEPPEEILEINLENVGSKTATISWEIPDDHGVQIEEFKISLIVTSGCGKGHLDESLIFVPANLPNRRRNNNSTETREKESASFSFGEEHLFPSTEFQAIVQSKSAAGWSKSGKIFLFKTLQDIPEAAGPIQLIEATCNSIHLEWKASRSNCGHPLEFYELQIKEDESPSEWRTVSSQIPASIVTLENRESGNVQVSEEFQKVDFDVKDLAYDTKYIFRVRVFNKLGNSAWTVSNVVATRQTVIETKVAARSIEISWSNLSREGIERWELQKKREEEKEWEDVSRLIPGAVSRYHLEMLCPNTAYHVRLRPKYSKHGSICWEQGPISRPIRTRPAAPETPSAPWVENIDVYDPIFASITHESIEVKWSLPRSNGSKISHVGIRTFDLQTGAWSHVGTFARCLHRKIGNLRQNSTFQFSVRVQNEFGWSPWSELGEPVSTRVFRHPDIPRVVLRGDSFMRLEWNQCNAEATFLLEMKEAQKEWIFFLETSETSSNICDLVPVTSYSFRMRIMIEGKLTNFSHESEEQKTIRRF